MLSYRHAFHAGNHADILKHHVLFEVLRYFNRKNKPYWYIDTHAGAGLYDLSGEQAQKVGEYRHGIARLQAATELPEALLAFRQHLAQLVPDAQQHYAGSPWLAQSLLRDSDRLRLYELHPADSALLQQNMQQARQPRHSQIFRDDGFKGLLAMLPPPTRRAVVLTDPAYEQKQDYRQVADTLKAALNKFAQGCYLVWYPCLSRPESQMLPESLRRLAPDNHLQAELHVHRPRSDGFGMHGSGMFVINPPYTLADTLAQTLPALTACLQQDDGAHFVLQHHSA
ncbi:23S rRNA (adenine(2030)-N(6))-methyltransferase RlmJ [Paralysiella testudinis]|uniref:Ribosomal RNA large subunit methyltransferase J n=1 Tax=Paralysiella testudinis TaxID=2809020 RepID=A0A892ZE58_9NEIS|nr:23S rRNA (adenine(2030)-N(6))-methyltransferase RlmJ [Paralysiella testudinis]QRQ81311.1 23S rRNA (adenine(2030)-N(6))-methyltransferase RlmJ [Paralysiella testudinis]